jgi:hypothetical protein
MSFSLSGRSHGTVSQGRAPQNPNRIEQPQLPGGQRCRGAAMLIKPRRVPTLKLRPRRITINIKREEKRQKQLLQRKRAERRSWLSRPQMDINLFHAADKYEELVNLGQRPPQGARRARKLIKKLAFPSKRLALLKQLVVAYGQEPTIENYLRIRHEFPEVETGVTHFYGGLPFLNEKFRKQGINPTLVTDASDGDELSIDALSLSLLESLVARSKLPKDGPGHIEKRGNAISDATVNYLISIMLEALLSRNTWDNVRMPTSLTVLIREQLCGANPDLHTEYRSREKRWNAASDAAQYFHQTKETISIRKLARALGVKLSTAARWLADEEFLSQLQWCVNVLRDQELLELIEYPGPGNFVVEGLPYTGGQASVFRFK